MQVAYYGSEGIPYRLLQCWMFAYERVIKITWLLVCARSWQKISEIPTSRYFIKLLFVHHVFRDLLVYNT